MSSEHDVRVVEIGKVGKHPNADTLSITHVDGRPVIFRTGEFEPGSKAVYRPVDRILPEEEKWAWLKDRRIRAMRLRGIFSMGLLAPAPEGANVGDDVRAAMGITVYEPGAELSTNTDNERDPGFMPVYTDIESLRKYRRVFAELDCDVVATEKVHGANARYVYRDGRLWAGSRNNVKAPDRSSIWWRAAEDAKLEEKLRPVEGTVVYGEVYGQVQNLKYGVDGVRFVAFDAYHPTTGYLDYDQFQRLAWDLQLDAVPVLYAGPFSGLSDSLADGPTIVGNDAHYREGFVVRPVRELRDDRLGRVIAKLVGEEYLLGKRRKQ